MKSGWKSCLIVCSILLAGVIINGTYWLLSDIQMDCYNKVYNQKQDLNLYEKCSIYSIHLGICCFGYILSPEATKQELLCLFPTTGIVELHSNSLSENKTISAFITKYPNATKDNPIYLSWKSSVDNKTGYLTPYHINLQEMQDLRCALAVNGSYLYKENDTWKITFENNEFKYPHLRGYTYIGAFKFHQSLLRYLQETGWLKIPKIVWVL